MKIKLPKIPRIEMFGLDIIKNMLFFTFFVFLFLFLLGIILAPSIKKFKETKSNYFTSKMNFNKTEQKLSEKTVQYQKLYKGNKRLVFALQREFDKSNFTRFSDKFMKIISIDDKNISVYNKEFIKKTYVVTATLKSPENFYKFVNAEKSYKNVLKIYFPVVFKAKNGEIKLLYKLEHFKIK